MWCKYEMFPYAREVHISREELAKQLDPGNPDGLAGEVATAEQTAVKAEAAVARALAGVKVPGYECKQVNLSAFSMRSDPVVLLSHAGAPAAGDEGRLTCRLYAQLVSGFEYARKPITASTPGITIPAPQTGQLSGVGWPAELPGRLLAERYFLDTANAARIARDVLHDASLVGAVEAAMCTSPVGVVPPSAGRREWVTQPWRPLYLMWQGSYYPIEHGPVDAPNWRFQDGSYSWTGHGAATAEPLELEGRILLTPQASVTVGARLQTLLDTTPDLKPAERESIEALQRYVRSKDDWDLLSQALNGFNDQLLKRTTGAFPSPATASLKTKLKTKPSLEELIAGGAGNPPRPDEDAGRPSFQPWRSGQFAFTKLMLVDEWGQALEIVAGASDAEHLTLHRPPEMEPTPSILAPAPTPLVQLSPALLQPGRLSFSLVSASDDAKVLGRDPTVDSICGWLLPNHLDQALMVYDADGTAAGELALGLGDDEAHVVVWRPAPNGNYPTPGSLAAIAHLGPFLQRLQAAGPAELAATLAAIDETLWTTVPAGGAFDRDLALLAGRPLAMVRARLAFELESAPLRDPSWNVSAPTPAPGWRYAVQLGNLTKLSDGLIGYLRDGEDSPLFVVAQSGARENELLRPIGKGEGLLELSFENDDAAFVSMLVDPRAAVHASSAILPVASVAPPAELGERGARQHRPQLPRRPAAHRAGRRGR